MTIEQMDAQTWQVTHSSDGTLILGEDWTDDPAPLPMRVYLMGRASAKERPQPWRMRLRLGADGAPAITHRAAAFMARSCEWWIVEARSACEARFFIGDPRPGHVLSESAQVQP